MGNTNGNFDITAANATAILAVMGLFPQGINLQMFATDQALSQDAIDITETRMGVDGYMVAGYTPGIQVVTINLEAASPSTRSLSQLAAAMKSTKSIYECSLVCDVPSVGVSISWTRGVLKNFTPIPNIERVLAPTNWIFHFQDMNMSSR